jgi:hypothetical protein
MLGRLSEWYKEYFALFTKNPLRRVSSMLTIHLTNGGSVVVDVGDYDLAQRLPWRKHSDGYAVFGCNVYLHRLLMLPARGQVVDHINGDKLDNRRSNLRICSRKENTRNQKLSVRNTSGFKGVANARSGKWKAYIVVDGKQLQLGHYNTREEAAMAYNAAAVKYYGAFAKGNEVETSSLPKARREHPKCGGI